VSWQDELRNLDEELAAGRLSAEDYRRRSDELNGQDQSGQPGSVDAEQSTPFPPAFRWETAPPSETTQAIPPVGDDEPEQTQVVPDVPRPAPAPDAQTPNAQTPNAQTPDDLDRTQVVSARQRPPQHRLERGFSPRSLFEPRDVQDSAPPWASSDLPPIQEPDSGWMRQGPEAFEPEREPRTWRIVGAVVAVVVLLGLVIGSYALWGRDDAPTAQPGLPAAEQQEPADPLMPADIGGAEESKDVETFADLEAVGFLTQSELGVLEKAAAGGARLLVTNFDEGKATVLVTRVGSPEQAVVARDALTALQLSFGFDSRPAPPGVNAVELPGDAETMPKVRAVYLNGDILVRLEMAGQDRVDVAAKFDDVLAEQLEALPADA
jgi:hypothetical protein